MQQQWLGEEQQQPLKRRIQTSIKTPLARIRPDKRRTEINTVHAEIYLLMFHA